MYGARECVDEYVNWLKQNQKVFDIGGTLWVPYHRALVPACPKPQPIAVDVALAKEALRESGTLFLRYTTRTFEEPAEWWYVECRDYNCQDLSRNTRKLIRRGYLHSTVRRIEPEWLAYHGYECYKAAFRRYQNAAPVSKNAFEDDVLSALGGPFEYWGVFCGEGLAGYVKCAVASDYVAPLVGKFHPEYLKLYPVYALLDTILRTYSGEQHKVVTNGFRSMVHATHVQEYLERFNFRKVYCDLNIVYREPVRFAVNSLYPLQRMINKAPDIAGLHLIKALLAHETVRRSFTSPHHA